MQSKRVETEPNYYLGEVRLVRVKRGVSGSKS